MTDTRALTHRGQTCVSALLAASAAALLLAGCGGEDRDGGAARPWISKPGVYQGAQDEKLTPQQQNGLRERNGLQR